ncbi:MAG: glycosyltransferase family 39 protein [Planctomycetes bacterium]|nr:glycosyltransferase family 39 protein [Planctomycetota bacterium]MCB9905978.1 glycosyltransferase family 39 protein [Planctomycetota bacterium]
MAPAMPQEKPGSPEPSPQATRCHRVAALMLALLLGLLLHSAWRVGPTYDEHYYVASGYAYWEDGDFALNREHPPLLKLIMAAPLRLYDDVVISERWADEISFPRTFFYEQNAAHVDRNLFVARVPMCLLTTLCALLVYLAGTKLWGPKAGLVGLALYAFNPSVLAHGPLAALDAGVSCFFFAAVLAFLALLERPSAWRTVVAGVAFGLANLAKFTSLTLVPIMAVVAALQCWRTRSFAPARWTLLAWFGGLTVFAAGYGFEAKSINEAWGEPQYVADLGPRDYAEIDLDWLADRAEFHGLTEHHVQRIRRARDEKNRNPLFIAIDRLWNEALADPDPYVATAAMQTLGELKIAESDVRKHVFGILLRTERRLDDERRLDILADLAGRRYPDFVAWEKWYKAHRYESWNRKIFTQFWIDALTRGIVGDAVPIPLLTAWKGIDYQLEHGKSGHTTYFKGRTLQPGRDFEGGNPFPEYYTVVMGVKNPLPWLFLVVLGIALSFKPREGWGLLQIATLLGAPLALFVLFSKGNALMGVKYLLPLFPFLCLFGARCFLLLPRVTVALTALSSVVALSAHPHELMYYNSLVGGWRGGPELTVVGDDWGQGARTLGRWVQANAELIEVAGGIYARPYMAADPEAFGLEHAKPIEGHPQGIIAVQATSYYRDPVPGQTDARFYAWLDEYEPFLVLDRSVYLFDTRGGPPGRDPRAD